MTTSEAKCFLNMPSSDSTYLSPADSMNTLKRLKCCVIIPCYDNAGTVRDVTERALNFCCDVIVVDDGSTDGPAAALQGLPAKVVRHDRNRGKGQALKTGFRIAASLGFERAITLDSDGQHYPEDIQAFAAALDTHPGSMLVGCRNLRHENMPGGNTFANRFSNFWFKVQTGKRLSDTQCGFRLYQLRKLGSMALLTSRYEAELELLVSQCWKGVDIQEIPIQVYYPPQSQRITHFRPFRDFLRITILNIFLCLFALIYGYPRKLINGIIKK